MSIKISGQNIQVCLFTILCICLLSPAIKRSVGDYFIFALAGLIILAEINGFFFIHVFHKNTLILLSLYIFILAMYKILGISNTSVSYHFGIIQYFLPFICIGPIFQKLTKNQMLFIVICSIGAMAFTMVQNYQLKKTWGYRYSIQLFKTSGVKAIINTQYTGAILLISGALFCIFLQARKYLSKIVSMIGVILCLLFNILVTQRGIILLLTIIMFPLLFLFNMANRSIKRYILSFLLIVLIGAFFVNYDTFLKGVGRITGSTRLASRMNALSTLIENGNIEDANINSLTIRIRLTRNSINTFLSSVTHFFLGAGHHLEDSSIIGNHSQVVDEFARYGILGGLLSILLMVRMLKTIKILSIGQRNSVISNQFNVLCVIFLLRACVGTVIDSSIGVVMFVIIPILFCLCVMERI